MDSQMNQGTQDGRFVSTTEDWRDLLPEQRLESEIHDFKQALNSYEANIEANRCINCYDAPCKHACPTGINIPQFISRIATGNTLGAARTILDSNILGLSCAVSCPTEVLCEGACVYNSLDKKPILIGKLQRFAVEEAYGKKVQFYKPGPSSGKKVALVGAGPASLACAHELRKQGHETVIFEKLSIPGGLNTHGIAPYKMKAQVSLQEIEQVANIGVKFRFGKELGQDFNLSELLKEYDAIFLGLGLGPDSKLDVPGADLPEVQGAVEFISKLKTAKSSKLDWVNRLDAALVVGGGNTALDACRELKKLGIPRVVVSYRRSEEEMSGYVHEFKYARQEGVEFWFQTLPVKYEKNSHFTATLQRTKFSDGKMVLEQESLRLDVGLVLLATGQSKLESLLKGISGLVFERGRIKTNQNGMTGHSKIFAGGDLANGGKEVVNAVAEGKRAAIAMNEVLKNG